MKRCVTRYDRRLHRVGVCRYGVATIWIIASIPAVICLLCVVLEFANLWMARVELRNALDAAALSAVKTWGEGGSTLEARQEGQDTAALNTITGVPVMLDLNSGGGANGNASSSGDILLGSISGTPGALTFDCNGTASCQGGTVNLTIAVETNPSGDTFADPTTVTGDAETSFRIESFSVTPDSSGVLPVVFLQSIEFDLSTMQITPTSGGGAGVPVVDDGFFDLRGISPSDNAGGIGNPNLKPTLVGVNTTGSLPAFAYTGGNLVDQFTSVLVTFAPPLTPGLPANTQFYFGTDTDRVGGNIGGGGGVAAQDFGGEFGTDSSGSSGNDPFTSTGATVRATIAGGPTFTGTLTRVSADRSELMLSGVLPSGDAFGVRTSSTTQVSSICDSVFGTSVGPFNLTSISYARFPCPNGPPELVRIQTFTCP